MQFKWDSSVLFLILANVITILFAVLQKWDFPLLLVTFWFQSLIIAIFVFTKILTAKKYVMGKIKVNGGQLIANEGTKMFLAGFFSLHNFTFHIGYGLIIWIFFRPEFNFQVIIPVLLFFFTHFYSFLYHKLNVVEENISSLIVEPYLRIIPLHIIIIIGALFAHTNLLVLFLFLKMCADVILNMHKHNHTYKNRFVYN